MLGNLVRFLGHLLFRIHVFGKEHIPSRGGALLVANHTSYMDFVLMVAMSPRPVHFIMNADVFRKPWLKPILKALHCIPVAPRAGINDYRAFNESVAGHIRSGKIVAIFAEGTVTRTGQILEFKKGVEHLSRIIGAPIIPIHFDNVGGTAFSYRAGRRDMIRLRPKALRRNIYIRIGIPVSGPVSAFRLRQRIKEMEAENFAFRLSRQSSLASSLHKTIASGNSGYWDFGQRRMFFHELPERIGLLNNALDEVCRRHQVIAVLLPKNEWFASLVYWAVSAHKTLVPLHPQMTNEERLSVLNASGARLMVTTQSLDFTRYTSCADETVYVEELERYSAAGGRIQVICKNVRSVGKSFRRLFSREGEEHPVVLFPAEPEGGERRVIPVYASQIKAVMEGLRQMYYFEKGRTMYSQLAVNNAYGYVLEWILPVYNNINAFPGTAGSAEDFALQILDCRPDIVIADPVQLRCISAEAERRNMPFLTHVFTAGVHPKDACVQKLSARGISVMTCAGMNESASVFAVNLHNYRGLDIVGKPLEQEAYDEDSIGKPIPGCALRVCLPNDHSVELESGEEGEIWIKGAVMPDPDEWYRTGITGTMDRKGFVYPSVQGGAAVYSEAC